MTDGLTLVPPERFGALLYQRRAEQGISVDDLQARALGAFTTEELCRIELGELPLDDDQINRLLRLYGAPSGSVVPDRSELVIDVGGRVLGAGSQTRTLPEAASLDEVLGRYLSLLYLLRGLHPGTELTLRNADLATLSEALERSVTEIESRLFGLMVPQAELPWFARIRHRLAVPAAGLLVGLSVVGGLLLIEFPDGARPSVVPATEIAGATSITRDAPGDGGGAPSSATTGGTDTDTGIVVRSVDTDATSSDPGLVGTEALGLVDFPIRSLLDGWTIEFAEPLPGYRGNTNTVTRTITVYVAEGDSARSVAGVLAHEVGHAFDVMYLDDATRGQWLDRRGLDGPWWPDSGAADFHVGAGDFAEAVAALTAASPSDAAAGPFDDTDLAFVDGLITRAGGSRR